MSKIPKKIKLVLQQHPSTCGVACIAMVTGKPYNVILNDFIQNVEEDGLKFDQIVNYLGDMGYSMIHKYFSHYGHKDFARNEMLTPFAPAHIVNLVKFADAQWHHAVVMDKEGKLYCPQGASDEDVRSAYMIKDVIGIFPDGYKAK